MPQHRGVFDSMKPAGMLLDHPEEWRGSSLTESCSLPIGHTLPSELHPVIILEIAGWRMPRLFQRPESILCSRAQWKNESNTQAWFLPPLIQQHKHSQGTQACGTWKLLTNSSKIPQPCGGEEQGGEERDWRRWEDLRGPWIVKALKSWILWKSWSETLICAGNPILGFVLSSYVMTTNYFVLSSLSSSRLVTHHHQVTLLF